MPCGTPSMPLLSFHCRLVYLYMCVCVPVYTFVCECAFVWRPELSYAVVYTLFVCVCTRTCMWVRVCGRGDQRSYSSIYFNCFPFYFLKHDLSLAWGSETHQKSLTGESLDWPVSPFAGITADTTVLGGPRKELKSLHLYSKYFMASAIFPTLFTILGCQVPSS